MLDYMRALHQRFCQEPECRDLREQAEELRQELKVHLDRNGREKLLKLVDLGIAGEKLPGSLHSRIPTCFRNR